MSIQNDLSLKSILKNHDVKKWQRSAELGEYLSPKDKIGDLGSSDSSKTQTFGQMLTEQIVKVNEIQNDANVMVQKLASGESNNLQDTLLAVERADLAFRNMNQIRMKVLDAYREVMKMQI